MKIVLTPDWFLNFDVMIDGFSFLILLSFFILSIRNYKLTKNKNSLYLGMGFMLIAVAELATIFTKIVLYYDMTFIQQVGQAIVTYRVLQSVDTMYYVGFFFHKMFTLLGLYLIYRIPMKRRIGSDTVLIFVFIVISAVFGTMFYYIFHIVALVLLALIIGNYSLIYKKNKSESTKMLLIAVSALAISHVIFMLSVVGIFYVFAQGLQLASYIILLALMIRILKAHKK